MSEPSAYELERLANMAANQRQLEAMGLVEAADACREPSPPKKQPKKRKKAQPKRELPKRHSTRANGGSENLLALDAEISKEEREKRAELAPFEPKRMPAGRFGRRDTENACVAVPSDHKGRADGRGAANDFFPDSYTIPVS